ncbi:MAG: radical SAM protein [Lentisphaeria bacterium]|jgi:pyruvate formate lyase activating enzyme|nr:radical SAM protein [Lentisphaeria bacterium]MDY0177425.1 radical SAM protein [Lentisphaeria bacterium]NLZ60489.1 radical SAM protein [Lentisphaerota bacterium]
MSFFRITRNQKYDFATLHNWGCTFSCPYCSYKLRSGSAGRPGFSSPRPQRFLSDEEIRQALLSAKPAKVYFMGGEPSIAPNIREILAFAKNELQASTRLGHTNGSNLDLPYLDGANVGFKAWSEKLHEQITGQPKKLIYDNFSRAFKAGMDLAANLVFIPELVGLDELEGLAQFLSALSPEIPMHVMGYIPVPGQDWRRPSQDEMLEAVELCKKYVKKVGSSHLSSEEALNLQKRDDRFKVEIIAGE